MRGYTGMILAIAALAGVVSLPVDAVRYLASKAAGILGRRRA